MNEKKKSFVMLAIVLVVLVLIITSVILSLIKSNNKINSFKKVINSSEPQIVYLSRPTCYYCNLIEPITDYLKEEYNLDYYQLNTDNFSNSELKKMLKTLNLNIDTFGTPYLAVVQDGQVLDSQNGYTDEDILFSMFQKHNLIKEGSTLNLNYIDEEIFKNLWNSSNQSIILIGKTGDTASFSSRTALRQVASQYDLEIYYFDTSKISTTQEYENLLDKIDSDLPLLTIVQNNAIVSKTSDITKSSVLEFLQKNNYIEK